MEKNERAALMGDVIYLVACALHDTCPEWEPPADLAPLYQVCQEHSLTAMVAMVLERYWKENPPEDPEQVTPWKQAKEKAIRKNILLNAERQRILAYLDSIGCWYLPLKGSLLQHDYPKFGMRQMSDNDILFDPAYQDQIYEFMTASGYQCPNFRKGDHDEYTKPPVYNFEFHTRLFSDYRHPVLAQAYTDVRSLLLKDEDNACGYHFSQEEFYVYMMAHAYKHSIGSGTGIRTLVDSWVYRRKHPDMDMDQVRARMENLEIWDFEIQCIGYGEMLFSRPRRLELLEQADGALWQFLNAGTHGNADRKIHNKMKSLAPEEDQNSLQAKLRYFRYRLFLPPEVVYDWDPTYREKPWKLVWFYVKRVFRAIFKAPRRIWNEIKVTFKREE